MIEIILALIVGVLFGCVTGLFPGVHINLVAAMLVAAVGYFGAIPAVALVVFIVAMAITHTFIDFIPSVFLGAPDEDSFLAVLPGHQLLREGKGYEAIVLTLYGSLAALPIILVFSFVFVWILPSVYGFVKGIIAFVLIFVSLYLIFREEEFWTAMVVFGLAGFLGLMSFNLPVREPLLPLLSGLFGVSGLVVSLKNKISVPKQEIKTFGEIKLKWREFFKSLVRAGIAAPLCSFLPGIGSGHAAVIGSELSGNDDKRGFLFLVGAINTIVMGLSFVTIYAIGKTRSGAAVAVSELLVEMSVSDLILVICVVLISGAVAFFVGIFLARFFARQITRFNYSKISFAVIGVIIFVNLILSNWLGILVLIVSSALGVFCVLSGVRRIQMMGVLLVPVIVFYLTA